MWRCIWPYVYVLWWCILYGILYPMFMCNEWYSGALLPYHRSKVSALILSSGYCLCGISSGFSGFIPPLVHMLVGGLAMLSFPSCEWVCNCVYGVPAECIPTTHLGSVSVVALTRMKWFLKMNEWALSWWGKSVNNIPAFQTSIGDGVLDTQYYLYMYPYL